MHGGDPRWRPRHIDHARRGPDESYWVFLADSGHYEVVLQAMNASLWLGLGHVLVLRGNAHPHVLERRDLVDGECASALHWRLDFLGHRFVDPDMFRRHLGVVDVDSLDTLSDLSTVDMTTDSQFGRWFTFDSLGHFLIELGGEAGCGDFTLSASVLVTEVPELDLSSYDADCKPIR